MTASAEKPLRILYVSLCEPLAEGSGSQQRAFVAVQALRRLGAVFHLRVPPAGDETAESPLFAGVLDGAALAAAQPALWQPLLQPTRWRALLHDSWITAGRVATPSAAQTDALVHQIRQRFGRAPFDIVYAFQAHAGAFVDAAFPTLLAPGGVSAVDWDAAERPGVAEQSRQRAGGTAWQAALGRWLNDRKLASVEQRLLRACGLTVCASEVDVAYFRARCPTAQVQALPNCVRLLEPPAVPQASPGRRVLFVGLINYWPNRAGLLLFLREIWPGVRARFADAEFRIVGRGVTADVQAFDGRDGVQVAGAVADLREHYAWCDVAVAPMRFSVGSSIKILEALAFMRPVIAFEAATRRHALRAGTEIGSARDAADFRQQLIALLERPEQARAMAERGHASVASAYGREHAIERLAGLLDAARRSIPATAAG